MSKVPYNTVIDELSADHWQQMYDDEWEEYIEDMWDRVTDGEMSWQWYMSIGLVRDEGWKYVVISEDHKGVTVANWLKETYPECEFKHERNHFLIKDPDVATWVALKWS